MTGDLAFGEPFYCLRDMKPHPWIEALARNLNSIYVVNIFRRYNLFWLVPYLASKEVLKQRMANYLFSKGKIEARLEFDGERGDFWDKVIAKSLPVLEPEKQPFVKEGVYPAEFRGMTRDEMVSNASTLVVGGSETTATLLSGVTYLLLRNPDKMRKLVDEIRNRFKNEDEISIHSVAELKYLLAVLDEALRMYPPVPMNPNRLVPKGGVVVCGKFVPEGVSPCPIPLFPFAQNLHCIFLEISRR
jgi:averantin hydroxylase